MKSVESTDSLSAMRWRVVMGKPELVVCLTRSQMANTKACNSALNECACLHADDHCLNWWSQWKVQNAAAVWCPLYGETEPSVYAYRE